ncbi:MAG: response regulator transcription factor [Spirochaetia bacterium]|nr:response regulator transcription factor [Spirochaetia bacterium]
MSEDIISVYIIEDHTFTREGIKAILNDCPSLKVVGESDNVDDGYNGVLAIRPKILLLDISLHGSSGLVLARRLKKAQLDMKTIVITAFSKIDYVMDAIENGISGYILKESPPEDLPDIIQRVYAGEMYIDSCVSNNVIKSLVHKDDNCSSEAESTAYGKLTFREQEILKFLVDGLSVKDIADQLFISVRTAENHKANIMQKLGCKNTVELVRFAIDIGLIDI